MDWNPFGKRTFRGQLIYVSVVLLAMAALYENFLFPVLRFAWPVLNPLVGWPPCACYAMADPLGALPIETLVV